MRHWKAPEEQLLKAHWQTKSDKQLATMLNRPLDAIRKRREKLGLYRGTSITNRYLLAAKRYHEGKKCPEDNNGLQKKTE